MEDRYDYNLKVIMVGDAGAGKSSALRRYRGHTFDPNIESTIGVDFERHSTTIKLGDGQQRDMSVTMQIWDTSGQERYSALTKSYFKGSSCVILAFDPTNQNSLKRLGNWFKQIQSYAPDSVAIVLVQTKTDLISNVKFTHDQITQTVTQYKKVYNSLHFIQCSAKIGGEGINQVFQTAATAAYNHHIAKAKERSHSQHREEPLIFQDQYVEKSRECCMIL